MTTILSITSSTLPTLATSPLRLQDGNIKPQVETVTEDDPDDTPNTEKSTNNNAFTESTTPQSTSVEAVYDPIVDAPDPAIITLLYVQLHTQNEH